MHDVVGSIGRGRIKLSRRGILLSLLAVVVAVGLVAVGRWTAPGSSTAAARVAPASVGCGFPMPSVMPSRACQQALERAYLSAPQDTGSSCGTILPRVMPSRECLLALQAVYLGGR